MSLTHISLSFLYILISFLQRMTPLAEKQTGTLGIIWFHQDHWHFRGWGRKEPQVFVLPTARLALVGGKVIMELTFSAANSMSLDHCVLTFPAFESPCEQQQHSPASGNFKVLPWISFVFLSSSISISSQYFFQNFFTYLNLLILAITLMSKSTRVG